MNEAKHWKRGEIVPASGIYACDCDGEHLWSGSTDACGQRLTPLPLECQRESWTPRTQAHPEAG
ncbi:MULTISPECIES: hypothetical protein [unclassified Streptomyces]|uniref:hypothetical protein n=1 Tax=unclassified Streptomyces TaxID=2593676 RepID=UPI0036473A8C